MANVTLSWTPNPVNQLVEKYIVYSNLVGQPQAVAGETPIPEFTFVDLPAGQYQFQVSAVNLAGEGFKSASVSSPSLPSAPAGLVLTVD
jgi:hypothetical protein